MIWKWIFIFTSCHTAYFSAAVLTKPTASVLTTNILEGDTIKLKCTYLKPQEVRYVIWYYTDQAKDVDNILFGFNKDYPSHDGPSNGTNAWRNRMFVHALVDGHRASGNEVADGYEVTLKNVRLQDDNEVLCVIADNGFGRGPLESSPVPLSVAVKPSNGILQRKGSLIAKTGEQSTFECVTERAKPINSVPITWHLANQQILSDITISTELNTDGKTYTITSQLRRIFTHGDNFKELTCKVKWTFGSHNNEFISSDSGKLNVQFPPVWDGASKVVYAEVNSKGTVSCLVKSNPPITSFKWYKQDILIHTEQNLTFNKLVKSDFTSYVCEAYNSMHPPERYTVKLQESGPPQVTEIKVLPNMTSTRTSLKWVIGSDGGHPPVVYSLYIKEKGQDFKVINGSITSSEERGSSLCYTVSGLKPNTRYEYKIVAKNRRKDYFPNKKDTSMEMEATGITKRNPEIKVTDVKIHLDTLTVSWDYKSVLKDMDLDNYVITVQVLYGVKTDDNHPFLTHPKKGTIPVYQSPQIITNNFDSSKTYVISLRIFENGYLSYDSVTGTESYTDALKGASTSKSPTVQPWWIVIGVVVILLIIGAIIITVLVIVFKCSRQHKSTNGQKRYSDHYLLETNIYDELRMKKPPPKLPTRNSSQKEDPVLLSSLPAQNNNITALQTVYLTQQITPPDGFAPAVPTTPQTPGKDPDAEANELEPLNLTKEPASDYLVPIPSPPISLPPVSVQITVNQNNAPANVTYGNFNTANKGPKLFDEQGEELGRMLPNEEGQYLPMSSANSLAALS